MRRTVMAAVVVIGLVLTGCNSENHPDYVLFKSVPDGSLTKIKSMIAQSGIQNVELPTEFPYPVTLANVPNNYDASVHQITMFLGNPNHVLEITAMKAPKDAVVSMSSVFMQDEQSAKLSDGTPALYGNNGHGSQLAWDKGGVSYQVNSSDSQNRSDLTEQQLIAVASSFQ